MVIFYGDNLKVKDKRDKSKIHLKESWERLRHDIKEIEKTDKEYLRKIFPRSLKVVILKVRHGIYAISYSTYEKIKHKLTHVPIKYIVELRQEKPKTKPKITIQKVITKPKPFEFKIPKIPTFSDPKKVFIFNAVLKYIKSHPELKNVDYLNIIDWDAEIDASLSPKENINKIIQKLKKLAGAKAKEYKSFEIPKTILEQKIKEVWSKYKSFDEFEDYLKREEKRLMEAFNNLSFDII